jgi:hypothetical protein
MLIHRAAIDKNKGKVYWCNGSKADPNYSTEDFDKVTCNKCKRIFIRLK